LIDYAYRPPASGSSGSPSDGSAGSSFDGTIYLTSRKITNKIISKSTSLEKMTNLKFDRDES
jgi:hypothetical protein